jgi:N6-adenosine-specific RNA methylase IME4
MRVSKMCGRNVAVSATCVKGRSRQNTAPGHPAATGPPGEVTAAQNLAGFAATVGRVPCILTDVALRFDTWSAKGEGRSPQRHYRCMTIDELAALPVAALAARDCWLFHWAQWPSLPLHLWLIEQWGFKYSSDAFLWVKLNPSGVGFHRGKGFTTRKNTEVCLLAKRGRPRRLSKGVDELIVARRRQHSRKPDQQYELIEAFAAGPYCELFARTRRDGWFAWGDQLDHFEHEHVTTTAAATQLILPMGVTP